MRKNASREKGPPAAVDAPSHIRPPISPWGREATPGGHSQRLDRGRGPLLRSCDLYPPTKKERLQSGRPELLGGTPSSQGGRHMPSSCLGARMMSDPRCRPKGLGMRLWARSAPVTHRVREGWRKELAPNSRVRERGASHTRCPFERGRGQRGSYPSTAVSTLRRHTEVQPPWRRRTRASG